MSYISTLNAAMSFDIKMTEILLSDQEKLLCLITGQVLEQLWKKLIGKLTNLINASFRLKYVPRQWNVANITMISKRGNPP